MSTSGSREALEAESALALPASRDGRQMSAGDLSVEASDPAFLRGDGVFEVVRVYRGVALAADEHLHRLSRSAAALGLSYDREALAKECAEHCARCPAEDGLVRLVVTRLGTRLVIGEPMIAFPDVMRLLPVAHAVPPLLAGVKSLSYAANCHANRVAQQRGLDDALLVDPDGAVLELPFASFGCVLRGRLTLPPLDIGILDSITRRLLLEQLPAEVRSFTLDDLSEATEACVIGTGMEVCPVSEIAGVVKVDPAGSKISEARHALRRAIDQRLRTETRFRTQQHTP